MKELVPLSKTRRDALWVVAGVLAITHVALMLGSFALQRVAPLGAPSSVVVTDHVTWSMTRGMGGGYLTAVSFLVFMVEASLLSSLLRGTTDQSRWCASTLAGGGVLYVAATFAGLANLGGALYVGHHRADVATVTALVNVHWFSIYVAILALGLFTLATSSAVLLTEALPQWVAYSGLAVGAVCIVATPLAGPNLGTLVWIVWFVALGVSALRRPGHRAPDVETQSRTGTEVRAA